MTDQFPPLAKFSARFGIIESADPVLARDGAQPRAQIHAAQLDLQGGPANTGSRLSDLLSSVEATYWRVPPPNAGDVLNWLAKVKGAHRNESVFGSGTEWREDFRSP